MRIIAGKHKGRTINLPKWFHQRPTTDFAKEALFSILDNWYYFDQIRVLDLFSGSGSISYEFASRGTKDITIVEKNPKYADFIRKQTGELFGDEVFFGIIKADAFEFVQSRKLDYDVIFADPPYKLEEVSKLPDLIFDNPTFPEESVFILEHSQNHNFEAHPYFFDHRKYGNVHFSFFSKEESQKNK